jgi:CHAT domain-containing protein
LAVLSSCNTGFGKIEKGEGVMSMARAFHFSGIPSVLMSLWKVPDKETESIMVDFYKFLKSGRSKSEALRLAKLNFLDNNTNPELKHPYYWSGFVINGNTEPISIGNGWAYRIYAITGILIFLAAGYLYRRNRGSL